MGKSEDALSKLEALKEKSAKSQQGFSQEELKEIND